MRRPTNALMMWTPLLVLFLAARVSSQPCTLCSTGDNNAVLRDKPVGIPNLPLETCGQVADTVAILSPELCAASQRVALYCGCPNPDPANSCHICHDGSEITKPEAELPNVDITRFFPIAPAGTVVNCEMFQAVLETYNQFTNQCTEAQAVSEPCGCPPPDIFDPSDPTPAPAPVVPPCTLCTGGEEITKPDKELSLGDASPIQNCADLAGFAGLVSSDAEECPLMQSIGYLCGCPANEDLACDLCPNGEPVPYPDHELRWHRDYGEINDAYADLYDGGSFTCESAEAVVKNPVAWGGYSAGFVCLAAQFRSSGCGCSASSSQKWFNAGYRISGSLSLIGSGIVFYHVSSTEKNRRSTYHQLMAGMSFFDCISSIAYILGPIMLPTEDSFYGSMGNDVTCRLQGFMLQWGMIALYFNVAVSIYFYLVIARNWREFNFVAIRKYVYTSFLVVGTTFAFAGLPHYVPQWGTCSLNRINSEIYYSTLFMALIPVCLAMLIITVMIGLLYNSVYQKEKRSKRWSMSKSRTTITHRVFWSSFFYVIAVYIAWPLVLISWCYNGRMLETTWWHVLTAFVSPSQGLWNSLVYFYWTKVSTMKFRGGSATKKLKSIFSKNSTDSKTPDSKPSSWRLSSSHAPSASTASKPSNVESDVDPSSSSVEVKDDLGAGIDEMGEIMDLVDHTDEPDIAERGQQPHDEEVGPKLETVLAPVEETSAEHTTEEPVVPANDESGEAPTEKANKEAGEPQDVADGQSPVTQEGDAEKANVDNDSPKESAEVSVAKPAEAEESMSFDEPREVFEAEDEVLPDE